jgi:hypothetical protein
MVHHLAALNPAFAAATSHLPPANSHLLNTSQQYEEPIEPIHNHDAQYSNDDEYHSPSDDDHTPEEPFYDVNDDPSHLAAIDASNYDQVDASQELSAHRWRWPPNGPPNDA